MAVCDPVKHEAPPQHGAGPNGTPPPGALARPAPRPKIPYRGLSLGAAFMVALESLARNKTRAFLATLGIVIGVGCVITMMALGEGAKMQMEEQMRRMGTNLLSIRPGEQRTGAVKLGRDSGQSLTLEDEEAIRQECPLVKAISPRVGGSMRVKYMNSNTRVSVMGVNADYFSIRNYSLAAGRTFLRAEMESRARVCVLGSTTAETLFGQRDPLGERMQVNRQPFTVIGVLLPRGGSDTDWDDRVWVPTTTAMQRLLSVDYLERVEAQIVSEEKMEGAQAQIEQLLRERHHIQPGKPDDFEVRNYQEFVDAAAEQGQLLSMLLAGIASVSLLVGGIGIMNIMLVSVIERTREIGIRRAVGARKRDILIQFLIEALVMCSMGAALGILLGVGAAWFGTVYLQWPVAVSASSMILSGGFAVAIGLFFGLYPAIRAAGLSPLTALRYQ